MNLKLLTLVPWMVLAGAALGQVQSADVLYTFHESTPDHGYRVGDECFVALETAEMWGWKFKADGTEVNVDAEGHTFRLTTRFIGDRTTIPLRKAVKAIGGETDWTSGTDTLNVYSDLTEISAGLPADQKSVAGANPPHFHAAAGLPFKAYPFYLNPGRTVIDLDGVRIAPGTKQTLGPGTHITQYRTNVVRVLIDTSFVPKVPGSLPDGSTVDLDIQRDPDQPSTAPPEEEAPTPPVVPVAPQPSTVPLSLTVDQDTGTLTTLNLHLSNFAGQAKVDATDPDTIVVTLPGVSGQLPNGFKADTTAVTDVSSRAGPDGTVVTFKLQRPMGSEIISSASGVTVSLMKPNVGDGKLARKIIVVDPGHGGHDRGAHEGSLNEKDMTLVIGKQLGAKLAAAGATVIMTRQTDVFIPLLTRSQISNDNHADFFISCHINSTGGSGMQSGTITFHHLGNKVAYLLATCIQHEIAKVNGLPNLGAWSDGKIYSTGFSVLRHTKAPAVLIEMGFINNPKDRARMLTSEFQDAVTTAIVRGLRVFLGETKPNG